MFRLTEIASLGLAGVRCWARWNDVPT